MMRQFFLLLYILLVCISMPLWEVQAQQNRDEYDALPLAVTNKPINNSPGTFRFAIMSDRTGGMQPRVFKDAAMKVNWLQPEFVLSVGDLIDGYTESPQVWEEQWTEFDEIVNQMSMPFYYVPGNHDTSNETLTKVWRERHGKDYYTFRYQDVLFVVVNTDEIEGGGISSYQSDYLVDKISKAQNVRWIMVFMHRPVWSYGDDIGYAKIESALEGKNYTVFSGHHHHYRYAIKNGQEHFTLATTGGGSYLRGVELGEFNHITWITMKETGPEVAHIGLDQIYPKDVLPIKDYDDVQVLRQGNFFSIQDLDMTALKGQNVKGELTLINNLTKELHIKGKFPLDSRYKFSIPEIAETLDPGQTKKFVYGVELLVNLDSLSIDNVNQFPIALSLEASFQRSDNTKVGLTSTKPFIWKQFHTYQDLVSKPQIDAQANDWAALRYDVQNPLYIKEDWDWRGIDDGLLSFDVSFKDEELYLFAEFKDDVLIHYSDSLHELQDKFLMQLQGFDQDSKLVYSTQKPIEYFQSTEGDQLTSAEAGIHQKFALEIKDQNYRLELMYSIANDLAPQINYWKINLGFMDHDRIENTKPSVLWWKPFSPMDSTMHGYGLFKNK